VKSEVKEIDVQAVLELAHQAGSAIMDVYKQDFDVYDKADKSPLTEADLASHKIIVAGLGALTPDIPILSEESASIPWETRQSWDTYWLVDPLDGTKEFIKRNGEFTVNIALIDKHEPVIGVVYAPVLELSYWAKRGEGTYKQEGVDEAIRLQTASFPDSDGLWQVVGSRSHANPQIEAFLEQFGPSETVAMGSSLKFCVVAEGRAHLYPRLGPTSEWDTAAAQCVVEEAGGHVYHFEQQSPLRYNKKESLLNPYFLVSAQAQESWSLDALKEGAL